MSAGAAGDGGQAEPDAVLLTLCAAFDTLQRAYLSVFGQVTDEQAREATVAPIEAAQEELATALCAVRATTLAGHQARAATLVGYAPDVVWKLEASEGEFGADPVERLTAAVLRDLAPQAVTPRPRRRPTRTTE
jgi:hypothetical protein